MPRQQIQHATIVGVGLLGGSIALALKQQQPNVEIAGIGRRASSLRDAKKIGAIDTAHLGTYEVLSQSDLILLATPVGAFGEILREIKPYLKSGAVVTDAGSTKAQVVRIAEHLLGKGGPFVGSHPMAGGEQKGPAFARAELLAGATCVVTPTANTPPGLVRKVKKFWEMLGMRTTTLAPADHDRAVARVSHLPHLLASLLMEIPRDDDFAVASTGLRDMTRLAGGDPEMWRDIVTTNSRAILAALRKMRGKIDHLEKLIERDDAQAIQKTLAHAKTRRDETIREK